VTVFMFRLTFLKSRVYFLMPKRNPDNHVTGNDWKKMWFVI